MKFRIAIAAFFAATLAWAPAFGQATLLPLGEQCFSALSPTSGGPAGTGTGLVGLLGTITGGSGGMAGTYFTALTGGNGTGATANVTVSGGAVTAVAIVNPGLGYAVADVLSASPGNIGNVTGFSVPISSVAINSSLAGGSVAYYIPNTNTPKQTWKDSGEVTNNTNPVTLDQNGCAVVYGSGIYRQVLSDSLGNVIWDKVTAATNGSNGIFWAAQAGGTGNAITVVDTGFAFQDGYNLQFLAFANNTGPTTIAISGGSPISIVKDTSTGPAALSGGEIAASNTPMLTYDATNVEFHLVNPAVASSSSSTGSGLTPPQGYLNLVGAASGSVVQGSTDVIAATTVYYSPFVGSTIPIWNGSVFKITTFSELTATLTASGSPLNTIQDECVFSNNGVPTLVTGPQWTTATAGSGSRGTGAGTPQLTRLQGIWVNAVSIIGYNGLSSYTIPANQCTYVGSIAIDGTAGQVSAYRTWGQSRKFGVWNAYNRQPITLLAGDPTASWTNTPGSWRQSHANAANFAMVFSGLSEETAVAVFQQTIISTVSSSSSQANLGIGLNSTSSPTGQVGFAGGTVGTTTGGFYTTASANMTLAPALGLNQLNMIEQVQAGSTNNTYNGSQQDMQLTLSWRG